MLLLIRSLPLSFALNLVPRMLEMAFQSFLRFQNFLGEHTQDPPRLRGTTAPCLYSWLLFSNQLPTSNFIETPENPNKFKNVRNMYNFAQNMQISKILKLQQSLATWDNSAHDKLQKCETLQSNR